MWDAQNLRIVNLADGQGANDAVNLGQLQGAVAGSIGSVSGYPVLGNRTSLQLATIEPGVAAVQLLGFATPNDDGGGRYKLVAAPPAGHSAWVQSADGAYWELDEQVVTLEMFGGPGDGVWLNDIVANAGSAQVSSVSARWSAADQGKVFEILLGASSFRATIAHVSSANSVTLSAAPAVGSGAARGVYYTDSKAAFVAMWNYVMAHGGGDVRHPSGKVYGFDWTGVGDSVDLAAITGKGITWDFNGSSYAGLRDYSIGAAPGEYRINYLCSFVNSPGVRVIDPSFDWFQDLTANQFQYGQIGLRFSPRAAVEIAITGMLMRGGRLGLFCPNNPGDGAGAVCNSVHLHGSFANVAYPFTCYESQDVTCDLFTAGAERSLFLVNVKHARCRVASSYDHKAQDVLLVATNDGQLLTTGCEDVEIDYRCVLAARWPRRLARTSGSICGATGRARRPCVAFGCTSTST